MKHKKSKWKVFVKTWIKNSVNRAEWHDRNKLSKLQNFASFLLTFKYFFHSNEPGELKQSKRPRLQSNSEQQITKKLKKSSDKISVDQQVEKQEGLFKEGCVTMFFIINT